MKFGRMAQVVLAIIWLALSALVLFRMGQVGSVLYGCFAAVMGTFTYPFFLAGIGLVIWRIFTGGQQKLPVRFIPGFICLLLAWDLMAALPTTPANDPWFVFAADTAGLQALFASNCGLIGSVLCGMFTILFSRTGAWIVAWALLLIGIVLVGWSVLTMVWHMLQENRREKKQAAAKAVQPEKPSSKQMRMDLDDKPAPKAKKSSIFAFAHNKKEDDIPQDVLPTKASGSIFLDADDPTVSKKAKTKAKVKTKAMPDAKEAVMAESAAGSALQPKQDSSFFLDADTADSSKAAEKKPARKRSSKAKQAAEPDIQQFPKPPVVTDGNSYTLPPLTLLRRPPAATTNAVNVRSARADGERLISLLDEFNVSATLMDAHIGPSVTKFEITLDSGVRVNRVTALQNDIKMALAATDIRIEAPIPGKSAVGIEVPNAEKTTVYMADLMNNIPSKLAKSPLLFALGKDLEGEPVFGRLDKMPHLLIAGATGSGKSVCVNSIICSLLLRTTPDEVKLILVDPKKVEFTPYKNVPHLLCPVITDASAANKALKVVVEMMDARYNVFTEVGVREITGYNRFVKDNPDAHYRKMPRIVVIIDELADLMIEGSKEVEHSIQRITQLARAAGIHLIVATQRPSVNVITGVIKANIPARIGFSVSSSVDSRTILDQSGAERLLGNGDMLFLDNGETACRRIQGVFIQDDEVTRIADYVRSQSVPTYDDAFLTIDEGTSGSQTGNDEPEDPLYDQVKSYVITSRRASTSLIQRRFSIGYARAARLMDALEARGIIGPSNGAKPREILVSNNTEEPEEEQDESAED